MSKSRTPQSSKRYTRRRSFYHFSYTFKQLERANKRLALQEVNERKLETMYKYHYLVFLFLYFFFFYQIARNLEQTEYELKLATCNLETEKRESMNLAAELEEFRTKQVRLLIMNTL